MVSGIPQVQRYIVDNYCMPDIEMVFFNATVRGQDNSYHMYRAATTLMDYNINFRDIIIDKEQAKAVVLVDLKVKFRVSPLKARRTFPCSVYLHFAKDPNDGKMKVCLQHDHHSWQGLWWAGGVKSAQIASAILFPITGAQYIATGKASEWARVQLLKAKAALQGVSDPPAGPCDITGHGTGNAMATSADLDACIRQASSNIGSSIAADKDESSWESWGLLGLMISTVNGIIGCMFAYVAVAVLGCLIMLAPTAA